MWCIIVEDCRECSVVELYSSSYNNNIQRTTTRTKYIINIYIQREEEEESSIVFYNYILGIIMSHIIIVLYQTQKLKIILFAHCLLCD